MKFVKITTLYSFFLATAGCGPTTALPVQNASPPALTPTPYIDAAIQDKLPLNERSFLMGTAGFIPRHYPDATEEDWWDFFASGVVSYGGLFGVHVSPGDRPNASGIPEQVQLAFEQMQGVTPYVAFAVNPEDGPFTHDRGRQLLRAAVATAKEYQPTYLSLGVESNSLYLFQQDSYDLYVQYVRAAYDEVKVVSPNTLVMNNFQFERMRGSTALTGQSFEPHWHLLDKFAGKMDLVSFTIYPFLEYPTAEQIPDGYLAEIRLHTELPVMITETGWPTQPTASGVKGSHEEQVEYMLKLVRQAEELEVEAIIWVFPHDAALGIAGGIFDHVSLKANDGTPKPGFAYWSALRTLPLQ